MAKQTKFEKVVKESDKKNRSSSLNKISAKIEREAKANARKQLKEMQKQKGKVNARSQKYTSTNVQPAQTSIQPYITYKDDVKLQANHQIQQEKSQLSDLSNNAQNREVKQQSNSSAVSHVDLDEIKKMQQQIKQEQDYEELETEYKYSKVNPEVEDGYNTSSSTVDNYSSQTSATSNTNNINADETYDSSNNESGTNIGDIDAGEKANEEQNNIYYKEDTEADGEYQSEYQSVDEEYQQNEPSEVNYREKQIVEQKLKENSHLSRISDDEIKNIQRQIAMERGEYVPEEESGNKKQAEQSKYTSQSKQSYVEGSEDVSNNETNLQTASNNDSSTYSIDDSEQKDEANQNDGDVETGREQSDNSDNHGLKSVKTTQETAPPEESLPDNITDEDIQSLLDENQKEQEEEEEENYEGMTEEEIAEAKERKRKLEELKQRYNAKETHDDGEAGDYKKNLDFTINTSIKRFKLKPPRKPFIIASAVLAVFLIIAGVVTYFILNKPPAPVLLSSIRVSQTTTYQYVGEDVDLRGIYITQTYTDGSTVIIPATTNMISRKSSNINNDFNIASYSDNTYVVFVVDEQETRLDISLTEVIIEGIEAQIYSPNIVSGGEIKFEEILILAQTTYSGTLKLNSANAIYMVGQTILEKTESGIIIPEDLSKEVELTISYNINSETYTTNVTLYMS